MSALHDKITVFSGKLMNAVEIGLSTKDKSNPPPELVKAFDDLYDAATVLEQELVTLIRCEIAQAANEADPDY